MMDKFKELWGNACTTAVEALNKVDTLPNDLLPMAAHLAYEKSLEAEVQTLQARIATLEGLVSQVQGQLQAALEDYSDARKRIATLEAAGEKVCQAPLSPMADCPRDISSEPCVCGMHDWKDELRAALRPAPEGTG